MRRYVTGLRTDAPTHTEPLEGIFLVRMELASYQYHPQKPFLNLHLIVLEPKQYGGSRLVARLYCSTKALWKLRWFLRDFGYDEELIGRDLIDSKRLSGLCGVVRVSEVFLKGMHYPSLEAFAPASSWETQSTTQTPWSSSS